MQQQVNLGQFVVYPVRSALDAKRLLTLYGVLLAILLGITLLTDILKIYDEHRLSQLKITLEKSRNTLKEMAAKYPMSASLLAFAKPREPICNVRFSQYLDAFARSIIPGTWLTEINLSQNGKFIQLKGHALQAGLAQNFLMELKQQPLLQTYSMALDNLTQAAIETKTATNPRDVVDFQLTAKMGAGHG